MATKGDIITTALNSLNPKFPTNDTLLNNTSKASSKKSSNLLTSLTTKKNGTYVVPDSSQETNSYSANGITAISHQALLKGGGHKKSPVKSLAIDTESESSKYNNHQNCYFGSFSTTNQTANSYNFGKGALVSGMNGNHTAKYARGNNESYQSNFLPQTKSLSTSRLLVGSMNFPSMNSNNNQVLKDTTAAVVNTPNEKFTLHQNNFKNNSTRPYSMNPAKSTQFESNTFEGKSSIVPVKSSFAAGQQQENTAFGNNDKSAKQTDEHEKSSGNQNAPDTSVQKKIPTPIPNHEPTKCSIKRNGIVKAYAANTNQGIVRNYNEDRVSIILNIMKPTSRANEDWPKCSFFGVYDGHGGVNCADFLRDHLHQYVIKEPSFPWKPKEALFKGFEAAERDFLKTAQSKKEIDRSGSCAVVVLIIGDMCYVANVGDSRAVMSGEGGAKIFALSRDHKPSDEKEQERITEAGGKIYQTQMPALKQVPEEDSSKASVQLLLGPHRVLPGRLSVSRTFGDIEAKNPKYGGNPKVVIATPEITCFKIANEHDFIVLASDGIYDKLSSRDVVKSVWESTQNRANSVHNQCGLAVENILREAIARRTLDNITVVMIGFKNFKAKLFPRDSSKKTTNENAIPKENEPISNNQNQIVKPNSSGQSTGRSSQVPRDRFTDQENRHDSNLMNQSAQHNYPRKNPAPFQENLMSLNVAEQPKKYSGDKGDQNLSDTSNFNKKRVGSAAGLNGDNLKTEVSTGRYLHPTGGTFRSMDYKPGEWNRLRNFSEK